jgi:hypothetical protein
VPRLGRPSREGVFDSIRGSVGRGWVNGAERATDASRRLAVLNRGGSLDAVRPNRLLRVRLLEFACCSPNVSKIGDD